MVLQKLIFMYLFVVKIIVLTKPLLDLLVMYQNMLLLMMAMAVPLPHMVNSLV